MKTIKVEKRDSQVEDYDPEKVIKVVVAAGLSEGQAKELVAKVDEWINKSGKSLFTSLQIRDRAIIEIQKMDEFAAKKFIWYEKYKDKNFGVKY